MNFSGGTQTNATTRPSSGNNTRTAPVAGLGGLGLPDMDNMLSAMPDPASVNQLLRNPAISQMVQSLISDPQYMNQVKSMLTFLCNKGNSCMPS